MVTKLQAEINLKKEVLPLAEQVPKEFHKYLDVFTEKKKGSMISCATNMGSQNQNEGHFYSKILQNIQPYTTGTNQTGQISEGKLGEIIHLTIPISHGFSIPLCQQERWETSTLPRLSIPKRTHCQKCIPSPTN